MPIFCLDPVEDALDSYHWRASTLPPIRVWVRAMNEDDARVQLMLATKIAAAPPNGEIAATPWLNPAMVSCTRDDTHTPPPGVIVSVNGAITVR